MRKNLCGRCMKMITKNNEKNSLKILSKKNQTLLKKLMELFRCLFQQPEYFFQRLLMHNQRQDKLLMMFQSEMKFFERDKCWERISWHTTRKRSQDWILSLIFLITSSQICSPNQTICGRNNDWHFRQRGRSFSAISGRFVSFGDL